MAKANIVLAAVAVVFGVGCFVLFKDTSAQRNRVRVLEAQVAQLRREMMANPMASQPVTPDTASTSEPSAQAAALPASQSNTPAAAKPVTAANSEWRALLADPAYRRARLAEARLQ